MEFFNSIQFFTVGKRLRFGELQCLQASKANLDRIGAPAVSERPIRCVRTRGHCMPKEDPTLLLSWNRFIALVCLLLTGVLPCIGSPRPGSEKSAAIPSFPDLPFTPVPSMQVQSPSKGELTSLKSALPTDCAFALSPDRPGNCIPDPISSKSESSLSALHAVGPHTTMETREERFHWRPALWQSLEFLLMQHSFRLLNDSNNRHLLIHKPFWQDYLASANHVDLSHWGDGDDFLTNYIGHPIQGAVSGNIFLQNNPQGRSVRFGRSSPYWHSRLKAMAWAAAYSTYFEIGPVLSEAAIGNVGGYTYVPNCGYYPCQGKPGVHYKPPTNKTGWVDFIITPTVGMGWIVMEDAIEREFVDRVAKDNPALGYKILRGTLSPSHSFANILAGKWPWYRYPDGESMMTTGGEPLEQRVYTRPAWKDDPRWGVGMQWIGMSLPVNFKNCPSCQNFHSGFGFDFDYRFAKYAYVMAESNLFPNGGSSSVNSGVQEVLGGLKVGRTSRSWGLFAQLRPGFMHYDTAMVPGSSNAASVSTTRFAVDFGGSAEYYSSKHSAIQLKLGTTVAHYLSPYPDPMQPPVSVLSDRYYTFQGSFNSAIGYQYRF